ncbi:hypothetical protein COTS27_01115 [Spirochaetota bacterium]|nr:hypothetical protein COTS27_01115 [Spirochaetota bacterium]
MVALLRQNYAINQNLTEITSPKKLHIQKSALATNKIHKLLV